MIRRLVVFAGLLVVHTAFGATPSIAPRLTIQNGVKQTAGPCVSNVQCKGIIEDQCGPGRYSLFDFWLETTNNIKPVTLYSLSYECADEGKTVVPTVVSEEIVLQISPCTSIEECASYAWVNCLYGDQVEKRFLSNLNGVTVMTTTCDTEPEEKWRQRDAESVVIADASYDQDKLQQAATWSR